MFDVHTIAEPVRHYGCYTDQLVAQHMAAHLTGVLRTPVVADEVDVEPWRARLLPRSIRDLPEEWEVWVASVVDYATGHRAGRSGIAPCGQTVLTTPVCAGTLRQLHFGSLCGRCWPSAEVIA